MAIHIPQRAKVISAIKDEGMSLPDAAKTFLVKEAIIKKWLRNASRTEVERLKKENRELKAIIREMILYQKMMKKKPSRSLRTR